MWDMSELKNQWPVCRVRVNAKQLMNLFVWGQSVRCTEFYTFWLIWPLMLHYTFNPHCTVEGFPVVRHQCLSHFRPLTPNLTRNSFYLHVRSFLPLWDFRWPKTSPGRLKSPTNRASTPQGHWRFVYYPGFSIYLPLPLHHRSWR